MPLIPKIIAVDSSSRDNPATTGPSDYVYTFPETYRDVLSIELVNTIIPNGNYNITPNNNVLYMRATTGLGGVAEGQSPDELIVPPGLYNNTELCNVINQVIEDNYGQADIVMTYDDISDKYTFTSADDGNRRHFAFYFQYTDRSIGNFLGFNNEYYVSANYVITAPNVSDLEMAGSAILKITSLERVDSNNDSIQNCFSIVPLDTISPNFGMLKDGETIQNDKIVHYFHQPQRLNALRIQITDFRGYPIEFNGYEHLLVFKITTLSAGKMI